MAAQDALFQLCEDDPDGAVELVAMLKGSPEALTTLVAFQDEASATPLHNASQNGHDLVVSALLAVGADKNAVTQSGETPLFIASHKGYHRVVEVLLAAGADQNVATKYALTPLFVATQNGHLQVVEMLLAAGADTRVTNWEGRAPLSAALMNGHHQVVEMLLTAGVVRDAFDHSDETPLFIASLKGQHQVVEELLVAGADKNASTKSGETPLFIASWRGNHQVVETLLAAGSDKNAATKYGEAPLYIASREGHHRVVEVLLAAGADKNTGARSGETPLLIASLRGHHQVVEVLLAAGASSDPNQAQLFNAENTTALYSAAKEGHLMVVRHLLSVGANKSKRVDGQSSLDIARSNGHSEVVTLLSNPGRPSLSPLIAASLTSLNRIKLMVVGRAAVGKTTLVRALFGAQLDGTIPSTDGIDLGHFSAGGIEFMTWDFGGQKVYRFTHQLFLSSHAVYLVLFNVSDPVTESLKEVRFWLNSISARISDSVVLLVGTHSDKVIPAIAEDRTTELSQVISKEYPTLFQFGERVHVISAFAATRPAFRGLLEAIIQAGQSVNFIAPRNYASALSYLLGLQLSPPVIDLRTVLESLQTRLTLDNSEAQILQLLKAFHTLGFISMFQNDELLSRGVIVLRPQWIAKLLATIVTTRHSFVNKDSGMLSHSVLVNQLWMDHTEFPPERHRDLIDLLVRLDIFFPVDQGRGYFVPCMLREDSPDVGFYLPAQLKEATVRLHRVMELECAVPISVIPPIMVELMECGELRSRWQQGCVVRIPTTKPGIQDQVWLQLWRSGGRKIELKVWGESIQTVTQWLQRVCSRIDSRLREFYHVKYRTLIPCRDCLSTDSSSDGHFTLVALRGLILKSHTEASCQPHKLHNCRLDMMVPDLLFLDLSSYGFVVPSESLIEICELGQGAFGKVLKMLMTADKHRRATLIIPTCSSRPLAEDQLIAVASEQVETTEVAVKFLGEGKGKENQSSGNFFEEFKHEVYLMSSLNDPNVVKLSGICLHPKLAMVMELVEGGDLYGQLNDPFRLRSRVFGLVRSINSAFSAFNMKKTQVHSFRYLFAHRNKLAVDDRELFEAKIVDLLAEPRANAIGWIQEQIDQNSRSVELSRLINSNPTDLGLTAKDLVILGMPNLPVLGLLGHGALEKARLAFWEWKKSVSVRNESGLVEPIERWEQQFFKTVEELFDLWVSQASFRDIQNMVGGRMKEIEDRIEKLSREQALLVAPVDEALRLKLAIDIARGMLHLHDLNPPIVHRDLKTPNVFLTRSLINFPSLESDTDGEDWSIPLGKVGDFGLSLLSLQSQSFQIRDRAEDDPLLNINATWAAPELLSGEKYSTPVDVYAMGIILWELLLRQHPFLEIPMEGIVSEVISGLRPAVPPSMVEDPNLQGYIEVMTRCWHQNPALRPSMREVYDSLRDICQIRYPKLLTKLLPPPPPRVVVSRLGHDNYEHETASIITSHSFAAAGSSASQSDSAAPPRVSCMVAPLKQQEVLWLGLESGHVALIDYRHGEPQREMLRWYQCCDWDKHQQRVTAITHLGRNSDEEGTVWTGSEDGSIHVWSPHLQSLDVIHDVNTLKGRLEYLARRRFSKKYVSCWAECEHGVLTWYAKRHDLKPIKALPMASVRSVALVDTVTILVVDNSGENYEFRQAGNDHACSGMTDWHRVLANILSAHASNAQGITRLAAHRQSQPAILALEGMDHSVWSANARFLLTEWGLDNTVDHHGLHRTMQLRPLRNVQLDVDILLPRLRVIGGFVRVAASVMWVAVGDRWVVLDVTPDKVTTEVKWQEAMVDGMDKIAAVSSVRSEEGKKQEVWSIDYSGRRVIWRCDDAENPEVAGELVDEGWEERDGRGYCMAQVGSRQVWMGTSQGRVLSWNTSSRHLVRSELQPLPASHPLVHSRSVNAVVSISGAHPPIVWSASRDQTFRRFSW